MVSHESKFLLETTLIIDHGAFLNPPNAPAPPRRNPFATTMEVCWQLAFPLRPWVVPPNTTLPMVKIMVPDNMTTTTTYDVMMDGMNITRIRALAQNAHVSTSTPEIAVFYASILYAKTQSLPDAYLYAQTLAANGQAMRSVRILERAGLLTNTTTDNTTTAMDELRLESILLAAHCLATMDEWSEALALLESATQQGPLSNFLEDDDDAGWQQLVQSLAMPCDNGIAVIHPVARLCVLRGRAHQETSNPTRAAVYWKRALRVDAKCVQALDLLLQSNMLTPHQAHEFITSLNKARRRRRK